MSSRLADVLRILEQALERDEGERQAYLESACGDDADLRREVEALLAERSAVAGHLLDTPPWQTPTLEAGQRLGRTRSSRKWARAAWEPSTRRATRG